MSEDPRFGAGRALDRPQGVRLGADQQLVGRRHGMVGRTRSDDAIDEVPEPLASAGHPGQECNGKRPPSGQRADDFAQPHGVSFNQLAGQQNERHAACLKSFPEHARQLGRHRIRWCRFNVIGGVHGVPCLGGVCHDIAQLWSPGHSQHLVPLVLRHERTTNRPNRLDSLDELPFLVAPDADVEPVRLGVQQIRPLTGSRLHDNHSADPLPLVVRILYETIDKGSQESAGAELQHRFRKVF